jgi:hypothetical protein
MGKTKTPFLVKLLWLTALTVVVWVGVEVASTLLRKPEPVLPAEILAPIDPSLDAAVLNKLQQERQLP